jgi:hypothetical protein
MNAPREITVKDATNNTLRKRHADIDATTGDVTEIRLVNNNGQVSKVNMEYDEFGNLQRLTKPQNQSGQRMWHAYEYDDQVHSFITKVNRCFWL